MTGVSSADPGFAAEPPPETLRLRTTAAKIGLCVMGPKIVAEALLARRRLHRRAVLPIPADKFELRLAALASGATDIEMTFVSSLIPRIDAGDPIVILAGHPRWLLRVVRRRTRPHDTRPERKDRRRERDRRAGPRLHREHAGVRRPGRPQRRPLGHRGPLRSRSSGSANGKVDAFIGFPPVPQELRARSLGHVVVNSTTDRPWSQYFCCLVAANREFVRKHPVATKRALRALLKAVNVCAVRAGACRNHGSWRTASSSDTTIALQAMKDVPYARWRDYDAEDSLRFYALRLREAGMIKSSPQKIIAQGTDWRFFNELKKELKG